MKHIDKLNKLDACGEAVRFAGKFKSGQSAWDNSVRGDWMLWLVGKTSGKPMSVKRKKLVLCACECARLSLKHVPKGEDRPLKCIETAEAWARGEASYDDLVEARRATAAYAYASAYASAARRATLKVCADIVRKHYPKVPMVKL